MSLLFSDFDLSGARAGFDAHHHCRRRDRLPAQVTTTVGLLDSYFCSVLVQTSLMYKVLI